MPRSERVTLAGRDCLGWTSLASTPRGVDGRGGTGTGGVARASLDHRLMAFKPLAWGPGPRKRRIGFLSFAQEMPLKRRRVARSEPRVQRQRNRQRHRAAGERDTEKPSNAQGVPHLQRCRAAAEHLRRSPHLPNACSRVAPGRNPSLWGESPLGLARATSRRRSVLTVFPTFSSRLTG
jgi:hypothetical protein